jgi:hypothetical protein
MPRMKGSFRPRGTLRVLAMLAAPLLAGRGVPGVPTAAGADSANPRHPADSGRHAEP